MGPIDYTLDVQTPFQSALQGYQAGAAIRKDQDEYKQQQAQIQAQEQQRKIIGDLINNKNATAADYARATLAVPGYKDQLDQAWKLRNTEQQQGLISDTGQVYAALSNGQAQVASDLLNKKADAMEAAGASAQEVQSNRVLAKLALDHPDFARAKAGMMLMTLPGGDKVIENLSKFNADARAQEMQPAAVKEANAKATTAEVAAGNAPTKTALDNAKAEEDVKASEAKRRIDELDIQIRQANSETDRGKLILEREKWQTELGKTQQGKGLAAQDALDSAQALIEQIKGVQNHSGLDAGTGTLGGIRSFFNSSDGNDFRKAVEGLKSPVFLNELSKLKAAGITLGQVTEAEGAKLERRIANLDPEQSTPSFKNQVGILLKDTEKFIEKIKASGELPTKGGAYVTTSPVYGRVNEGDINRLLTQYPGTTRAQVLQFLQSQKSAGGASGQY